MRKFKTIATAANEVEFLHQLCQRDKLTLRDAVCEMAEEIQRLQRELARLDTIAPKRIETSPGHTVLWRCPDILVPMPDKESRQTTSKLEGANHAP